MPNTPLKERCSQWDDTTNRQLVSEGGKSSDNGEKGGERGGAVTR